MGGTTTWVSAPRIVSLSLSLCMRTPRAFSQLRVAVAVLGHLASCGFPRQQLGTLLCACTGASLVWWRVVNCPAPRPGAPRIYINLLLVQATGGVRALRRGEVLCAQLAHHAM